MILRWIWLAVAVFILSLIASMVILSVVVRPKPASPSKARPQPTSTANVPVDQAPAAGKSIEREPALATVPKQVPLPAGDASQPPTDDPESAKLRAQHQITHSSFGLASGASGDSVLIVHGKFLTVLDKDGAGVQAENEAHDRNEFHTRIFERAGSYVVLNNRNVIKIIDKPTLAVTKAISLPSAPAMLSFHPAQELCYVCYNNSSGDEKAFNLNPVFEVDETTGKITAIPETFGQALAVDPSGRYLFTSMHGTAPNRAELKINLGRDAPNPGEADLLMVHGLESRPLRHLAISQLYGVQGKRLVISPDGRHVAYFSVKYPKDHKNSIPVFAVDDIKKPLAWYQLDNQPTEVAFHPTLPLAAATDRRNVYIYDRESGRLLTDRLDLEDKLSGDIGQLFFPPGGRSLLIARHEPNDRIILENVPLRLTPQERTLVNRGWQRPQTVRRPPGVNDLSTSLTFSLDEFEALRTGPAAKKSADEIARQYADAVVSIDSSGEKGTGLVIGSNGYILTYGKLFPLFCDPWVTYQMTQDGKPRTAKARATVIRKNDMYDMALIKISPESKLNTVGFAIQTNINQGEGVTMVRGPAEASRTPVSGAVVDANRELKGTPYIQSSVKTEGADHGASLFNQEGKVVGMVVPRSDVDKATMALPVDMLLIFLGADKKPYAMGLGAKAL